MNDDIKRTPPIQDKYYSIAERIQMGENGSWYLYCAEEDKFYIYEDGYWRQVFEFEIMAHTAKAMPGINKYPISGKKQVVDNLRVLLFKRLSVFNKGNYVNFKEGMFNIETGRIEDHHPDYFSTMRMDYNYNWNANCPLWLKTLGEIFDKDQSKINILQEYFGYCLTKDTKREKAMLLLGESRTGKSTILQTGRALIGKNNSSSVPLKSISNPQYTPMLMNKLINIDSDVSSKATDYEAEFKIITSGEPISCNQKFIPTFEFTPYCKLLMAANEFPRITDHSSAFYKRLILIPCDRVFDEKEQDIHLKENLIKELPGIFNWAYEGLERLNARGRFEHNQFMADAIEELREESNPVEVFFREHIEVDVSGGFEIEKGELYQKYYLWAKANGNAPMASAKFSVNVYRKYCKYTPKNTKSFSGSHKRVWKNIKFVGVIAPLPRENDASRWEDD